MIEDVVIKDELENFDPFSIPKYAFNGSNVGFGVDLGVDFRPIEQLLVSASVMDLGFINWKDGVNEIDYRMNYDFTGLELNPFDFSDDYGFSDFIDSTVTQLGDSISSFLSFTSGGSFSKRLNTKLFVGASYFVTPKINFGILSRTDFLNNKVSQQVTASANFTTGRFINFTLSYSYMNAYFKNIGAGFSFNVGPLNMYLISDNALNA